MGIQNVIDRDKAATPFYISAWVKIAIGVLAAVIFAFLMPGQVILPIGLIITGIIAAVTTKKDMI